MYIGLLVVKFQWFFFGKTATFGLSWLASSLGTLGGVFVFWCRLYGCWEFNRAVAKLCSKQKAYLSPHTLSVYEAKEKWCAPAFFLPCFHFFLDHEWFLLFCSITVSHTHTFSSPSLLSVLSFPQFNITSSIAKRRNCRCLILPG